jgi:hypothetical protein
MAVRKRQMGSALRPSTDISPDMSPSVPESLPPVLGRRFRRGWRFAGLISERPASAACHFGASFVWLARDPPEAASTALDKMTIGAGPPTGPLRMALNSDSGGTPLSDPKHVRPDASRTRWAQRGHDLRKAFHGRSLEVMLPDPHDPPSVFAELLGIGQTRGRCYCPVANRVALLMAYTVPSTPIRVGV